MQIEVSNVDSSETTFEGTDTSGMSILGSGRLIMHDEQTVFDGVVRTGPAHLMNFHFTATIIDVTATLTVHTKSIDSLLHAVEMM